MIEKGQAVGAHILSGACIETRSLKELFPTTFEYDPAVNKVDPAPIRTKVTKDRFFFLTKSMAIPLPVIPQLHNSRNYIVSVGELTTWLAGRAEGLGVDVFPGFPGAEVLYDPNDGSVTGVATRDSGIGRNGVPTERFQRGVEIQARQTIFAEGSRGSLTKKLFANKKFNLRKDCEPQTFGLGIKEIWELDPSKHESGLVMHTVGYPTDSETYAGTFMYHFDDNKMSVGLVIGLDYKNPYITPYMELQRWKHHPKIKSFFEGGKCIQYGARTLAEGGLQSLPKLSFPGGILIGDCAGFLNVPKIKGVHSAIKSGILGADAVMEALSADAEEASSYTERFKSSWLYDELYRARNIRPYFNYGVYFGLMMSGIDAILMRGKAPYTLGHHGTDHEKLKPAANYKPIEYPKPDGKISFDLLTNLSRANTNHNDDQPAHLKILDSAKPVDVNLKIYAGPETRYCPAKVYEFVNDENGNPRLQINFQNCVHCKACDIKDPTQNIDWTVPEGGGGPGYFTM